MATRKERLGDTIRDIVAESLSGGRMNDPRLEFVTITRCKLSADLLIASLYFRIVDTSKIEETKKGLKSAEGVFRHRLAEELDIRKVPRVRFFYDDSIEKTSSVEAVLRQIRNEK